MNELREHMRGVFALPLEQQREALQPLYEAAFAAYGRDWEANTAAFSDDYVFHNGGTRVLPGYGSAHGREEYIANHSRMLETLDVERIALDELRPLGDGRVLAFTRIAIRAGGGTIDQLMLDLTEWREGELFRQTLWFDREEGLRELGL